MKKIVTGDNSETFLNTRVGESYHSHTGAVEEALRKYSEPCNIRERAKSGKLRILDMFFGLGYNSAMAVSEALAVNPDCEIEVIGVENDAAIIRKIREVNPPIAFYEHYKKLAPHNLAFEQGRVKVRVHLSDATRVAKLLRDESFDVIFYDPFSPKTMPDLWSQELFSHMHRVLDREGVLATYSCARAARENMSAAGFLYDDGPKVGRRGPGTVATKWVF